MSGSAYSSGLDAHSSKNSNVGDVQMGSRFGTRVTEGLPWEKPDPPSVRVPVSFNVQTSRVTIPEESLSVLPFPSMTSAIGKYCKDKGQTKKGMLYEIRVEAVNNSQTTFVLRPGQNNPIEGKSAYFIGADGDVTDGIMIIPPGKTECTVFSLQKVHRLHQIRNTQVDSSVTREEFNTHFGLVFVPVSHKIAKAYMGRLTKEMIEEHMNVDNATEAYKKWVEEGSPGVIPDDAYIRIKQDTYDDIMRKVYASEESDQRIDMTHAGDFYLVTPKNTTTLTVPSFLNNASEEKMAEWTRTAATVSISATFLLHADTQVSPDVYKVAETLNSNGGKGTQ